MHEVIIQARLKLQRAQQALNKVRAQIVEDLAPLISQGDTKVLKDVRVLYGELGLDAADVKRREQPDHQPASAPTNDDTE